MVHKTRYPIHIQIMPLMKMSFSLAYVRGITLKKTSASYASLKRAYKPSIWPKGLKPDIRTGIQYNSNKQVCCSYDFLS